MNKSPSTLYRNFWWEGIEHAMEHASQPALDQVLHCDFLVIGGGLSGLSAALHLKKMQPAAQVALLEAGKIGNGSSGLNSGQCGTRIGPAIEKQVKSLGKEMAAEIYRYSQDAMQYAASLIEAQGIQCNLQASSQWQVALTEKDARTLEHRSLLYQSLGFDVPLIGQQKVRKIFPESSRILNAIEFPAYMLNPYKLCLGLKQAALHAGVCLYENTKVVSHKGRQTVEFSINGHRLHYRRAILAVNGGIAQLSEHTASVLPIAVFAAVTRPLSPNERHRIGWSKEQGLFDARPMFNFLRLTPGDRILIGGEYRYAHSGQIEAREQREYLDRLQRQLAFFFPSLQQINFEYQWHGIVGCTLDEWPVIGPSKSSNACWHIGAWNGHGVAASLIAGREVAQAIIDHDLAPRFPWHRSSVMGLGHPAVARMALPYYLAWLRTRSRLAQHGGTKDVHV
jgi:gamma-glutamylputrescine oxidase